MVKDGSKEEEATMADQSQSESSSVSVSSMSASTSPSVDDSSSTSSGVAVQTSVSSTGPGPNPSTVLVNTYEVVHNGNISTAEDSNNSGGIVGIGGAASGVEVGMTNGMGLDSASTPGAAASPPLAAPTYIPQPPMVAPQPQTHPAITMTPVYNINTNGTTVTSNATNGGIANTLTCPIINQNPHGPSTARFSPNNNSATSSCGSTNGTAGGESPQAGGATGQAQHQSAAQQQQQQHVVHVHVNPGETFSVRIGDQIQHIQGPATVRMVSNNGPPLPMPMQVPPGHMVQQIVDENGILTHVILSPQPPGMPPGPPMTTVGYYGSPNGTPQQMYPPSYGGPQYPPYSAPYPPHHHPHQQPPHMHTMGPPHHLHGTPPPQCNSHNHSHIHTGPPHSHTSGDDRKTRQKLRLQEKLRDKRRDHNYHSQHIPPSPRRTVNGDVRPTEAHSASSSSADGQEMEEDRKKILSMLGDLQQPKVSDIESRSALILLNAPEWGQDVDIQPTDFKYELQLSEKRDGKFKTVYNGDATEITLKDLRPATEYYLKVSCILENLKGDSTEPVSFKTDPCEPDPPQPPRLVGKSRTHIHLKWNNSPADNGSKISSYSLECDRGQGDHYVEVYSGPSSQRQYKLTKLTASTRYQFRLAANNAIGKSKFSEPVCYYTSGSAPSIPDPPMCSERFVKALTISWIRRPNDDEFTLQMEDSATGHGFLSVYNGQDLSYKIKNLRRNTEYKYKLQASNEEGLSKWSDVVCYRTLPDRPSPPAKLQLKGKAQSHSFRVAWEQPKDNGGSEVTSYLLEVNDGRGFCPIYKGLEKEYTCDEAQPGTTYLLQLSCVSAGGQSDWSEPLSVTTMPVVPGPSVAPKLHGKPKATSLHLRWVTPSYEGGAPVTEYEVVMVTPDNASREVYRGREQECVVAGLLPGRPYLFQVRPINKAGAGPWSDSLEVVSGPGVPDPPKMPSICCRSPHSAVITWEEPVNNGARISDYRLEWQQRVDTEFVQLYTGPALSYEVKGTLSPATTYSFRVQALNSAGAGPFSTIAQCVTPPSSPGPVVSVRASATATSIHLTWKEPLCNGSLILSYNVNVGDRQPIPVGNVLEYVIDNLVPETTYRVRVQGVNEIGVGAFSSPVKVTTRSLPPTPPRLECVSTGPNALKLKWGDGKNPDLVEYCLEMLRDNGSFHPIYHGRGQSHKVNKLSELTDYQFRIYASNEAGNGPYSDVFTCSTTKAPPPAVKSPRVCDIHLESCMVEWASVRPMGRDSMIYTVQLQKLTGKDHEYKQVYQGADTSCRLDRLTCQTDYQVRVCATRKSSEEGGEDLIGAFSPGVSFTTLQKVTASPSTESTLIAPIREKRQLTDQEWAVIILIVFAVCAGLLALLAQQIIAYTNGGTASVEVPTSSAGVSPPGGASTK